MAHSGSDVDRLGMYAADPMYLLDLDRSKPVEDSWVQHEPNDITLHEAKKHLKLILGCNPTASELLWLNEYEIKTEFGQSLIEIRESFLSATRIRYGYVGFAGGQLNRFFGYDRTDEVNGGRTHAEKNARHLYRLLWQGLRAYEGGGIIVRLPAPVAERARAFGERAAKPGNGDMVQAEIDSAKAEFEAIDSPLPEFPDDTLAREWLLDLRRSMFE